MADEVKDQKVEESKPAAAAEAAGPPAAKPQGALNGKVKWFDDRRGYGFLRSEKGEDVFVHFNQVQGQGYRSLKAEEAVTFVMGQGKNGPEAQQVARLAPPPASAEEQAVAEKRQRNKETKKEGPGQAAAAASKPAKKPAPKK